MNEARISIRTIDGSTYTSHWSTDLYEHRDEAEGLFRRFSDLNHISLELTEGGDTLYFNPANIIYAKVETR